MIDLIIDMDGDLIVLQIQIEPNLEPIFFFEQRSRQRHLELIDFAVDVEVQIAGAIDIEIAETIRISLVGEIEHIPQIRIIPEAEIEGYKDVILKNRYIGGEDMVRRALREQAILRFKLQALGAGRKQRKAEDKTQYDLVY